MSAPENPAERADPAGLAGRAPEPRDAVPAADDGPATDGPAQDGPATGRPTTGRPTTDGPAHEDRGYDDPEYSATVLASHWIQRPGPEDDDPGPGGADAGPEDAVPAWPETGPDGAVPTLLDTGPEPAVPAWPETGLEGAVPTLLDTGPDGAVPTLLDTGPEPAVPARRDEGPDGTPPARPDAGPGGPAVTLREAAPDGAAVTRRETGPGDGGEVRPDRREGTVLRFGPGVTAVLAHRTHRPPPLPAPPPAPPRRRLRRYTLPVLVFACVLAFLAWQRLGPQVAVRAVAVTAEPAVLGCGRTALVTARVTTDGRPGTLTYRWVRSDGTSSPVLRERLERGRRLAELRLRWTFEGRGRYEARAEVHLLTPARHTAGTRLTYACP